MHKSPQIIDQKFKCELNISNMFWRQLWFEKSRVTMLTLHQELEAFDEQDLRFDLVLWNSNLCFCNRLHHLIFHVTFQTNHLQLFNWSYLNHFINEDKTSILPWLNISKDEEENCNHRNKCLFYSRVKS